MSDDRSGENSYRSILKGMSIFGGVKVFEMLVGLVRGKFIAMILGPEGMGINSIFNTSANTLSQVSVLGLNLAIVKETASARGDADRLSHIIKVSSLMVRLAAFAGAVVCAVMSRWLSEWSFGSGEYYWQFILLSIVVFLLVSNYGKSAVLQGLHEVKRLSRASLVGSLAGLVIGVPLYYVWGNLAIVPAFILMALVMNLFYSMNLKRSVAVDTKKIKWADARPTVRKLLSLGVVFMGAGFLGTLCSYLLNVFVRAWGGLDTVGFYQAAGSVTNQLTSVVFAAMALDYFPRLATVAQDNVKMSGVVNRQAVIISLVMCPVSILLMLAAPLVVRILFTETFTAIVPLLRLMGLGIFIKALGYPLGYITLSKDNKRLYFWLEGIFANLLFLMCSIGGFAIWGLDGFGYGLIAEQTVCLMAYVAVNGRMYQCSLRAETWVTYAVGLLLASVSLLLTYTTGGIYTILAVGLMLLLSVALCVVRIRSLKGRGEETD